MAYRVLFVCLGNICRSPAAEIVFNAAIERAGLKGRVKADSCGTASYHTGEKPDHRMLAALERAGYAWGGHRARTFCRADFERFDLIIPQDESNRNDILSLASGAEQAAKVRPMSDWFGPDEHEREVPDPYYGGPAGFDAVVRLLERATEALVQELREV
ncbi:MAG: low molecular weight phosphotyrosine protein phosphatase [Akkermansia sp.]|nr:low molecular weight phosphotyrosine protein phosphatase [Akkermansia sp.]